MRPNANLTQCGLKSFKSFGVKIWNHSLLSCMAGISLDEFKTLVKPWHDPKCKSAVCAVYTWPNLFFASFNMNVSTYVYIWMHIYLCVCKCECMYSRAFGLLAIWCLRPWWVRILPSAEEDNLSPFDSNIACLCQSIEINNNKHVYRQSQVRMPNGCGLEWAECSLIIGTGCRVQVFSLILDSSVGLSAGIRSAGDLVSETLMGSNPAFSRGRQLVSFRFEYRLPVPEHRN